MLSCKSGWNNVPSDMKCKRGDVEMHMPKHNFGQTEQYLHLPILAAGIPIDVV